MATVIRKKTEDGSIIHLQPIAEVEGITLYAEASNYSIPRVHGRQKQRIGGYKSSIDRAREVEAFVPQ